jgi:hypothetical protein
MAGILGLSLEGIYLNWQKESLPWFSIMLLLESILLGFGIIYLNEVLGVKKLRKRLRDLTD